MSSRRRPALQGAQAREYLRLMHPTMLKVRIRERLHRKLGRKPTDDEIANAYTKVKKMVSTSKSTSLPALPPDELQQAIASAGHQDLAMILAGVIYE